uniref:Uncharacterized protein n=1 Tax=Candidatus Kentrum sp. TC TaxID=2126339 RepID=A0A451ACE7_9GAMM|nr:MAG: hypothetical protein BECKTC1821F_GA0114240_11033 [Candidatus Kentron sp. TC]
MDRAGGIMGKVPIIIGWASVIRDWLSDKIMWFRYGTNRVPDRFPRKAHGNQQRIVGSSTSGVSLFQSASAIQLSHIQDTVTVTEIGALDHIG